jgi:hypothetical protein
MMIPKPNQRDIENLFEFRDFMSPPFVSRLNVVGKINLGKLRAG